MVLLKIQKIFLLSIVVLGFGLSASAQKRHVVEIKKMKFVPAEISVKKGDTVVWINKDFFPHDVTEEKNKAWSSEPFGQNQSWSKVITKDENYFCNLHKVMKGKVILKN